MSFKGTVQFLSVFALAGLIALGFQNCTKIDSPINFLSTSKSSVYGVTESGNGGSYDGKPKPGTYIRHVSTPCDTTSGVLKVDSLAMKITKDLCIDLSYNIEFSDPHIDYSIHNPNFIGFNSAIYEYLDVNSTIENPSLFMWCRAQNGSSGFDVVVRQNSNAKTVYLSKGEGLQSLNPSLSTTPPFDVSNNQSGFMLTLQSTAFDFKLQVDTQPIVSSIYPAVLHAKIDNQLYDLSMRCRSPGNESATYARPDQILGLYQMDEPLGIKADLTTIRDASSAKLDGTLSNVGGNGAAIVQGHKGRALSFDGIDDDVDISQLAPLISDQMSFTAWVKPSLTIAPDKIIFATNTNAGLNKIKLGLGMCDGVTDRTHLTYELDNVCVDTGRVILDDQWHHVGFVFQNGQIAIYSDGTLVSSHIVPFVLGPTDVWSLGQETDNPGPVKGDYWEGLMDEVVIWKVPLLPQEILQSYLISK